MNCNGIVQRESIGKVSDSTLWLTLKRLPFIKTNIQFSEKATKILLSFPTTHIFVRLDCLHVLQLKQHSRFSAKAENPAVFY